MTTADKTRIWKGSTLSVKDGSGVFIDFAKCIDFSIPGVAATKIDASTADSDTDDFRLGIPDRGQAVFNVFDNMDSLFLIEIDTMQDTSATRVFKLVLPEGTKTTRLFTGYVIDQPITENYNELSKMTLTLKVVKDYWWNAPLTAASIAPTSGVAAGGEAVTITGTGFIPGATTVTIGGNVVAAADITVNTARTTLTFDTPAHAAGAVDVTVTSPEKTTSNIAGGFTYS